MHPDIRLTPATCISHGTGVNWHSFEAGKPLCLPEDFWWNIGIQAMDNPAIMFFIIVSNASCGE